jgi:hypothetical protein
MSQYGRTKGERMTVSAWSDGSGRTYGIRVGKDGRDNFFDPAWQWIDVDIEGTTHRFQITDGFWNDCPEFRDSGAPVIREWLRRNNKIPWEKGKPPKFVLEVVGAQHFRLIDEGATP